MLPWRQAYIFLSFFISEDIEQRAKETSPKFIFTDKTRASRLKAGVKNLQSVQEIFSFDGQVEGCTSTEQLLTDDGKGITSESSTKTEFSNHILM